MTRTDLMAAAFHAQELDQPVTASVVAGGFANGRAESRITIGRALARTVVVELE